MIRSQNLRSIVHLDFADREAIVVRHDSHHPPVPRGATTRELSTIERLHRAGTTSDDEANRPVMLEGVALLVDLIEQRNQGRAFFANVDDHNEGAG